MNSTAPKATVVITTKNRRAELRDAVASCFTQTVPIEVIVIDDGSTDGTTEMVREDFPTARVERYEQSSGYVSRRNRGAELATTNIIFSIDDDAIFASPRTVEQTLSDFGHPRLGAVAIPFINVRQDNIVRQKAPDDLGIWLTQSYIGTAHAVRRDLFMRLGGYRSHLIHQGEESDFCTRMLDAGYVVRMGNAEPLHHFESPRRDLRRMDYYGRRNNILYAWHNVPSPYLPLHLAATTFHGLVSAARCGRPWHHLKGLCGGYIDCLRWWSARKPISVVSYRLTRKLCNAGLLRLDQIEAELPALT